MSDNFVKIALLGCGTVGSEVINLLRSNHEQISERAGTNIVIKRVLVRDVSKNRGIHEIVFTEKIDDVLNDPELDIVVEVMGGVEPAYKYVMEAIGRLKHIVTANKALLSEKMREIFRKAEENRVDVYLEASVGGGIPVIQALHDGLAPDKIKRVTGIVNGTTNYILTRMEKNGLNFEGALREAQEKGFAEADPSFDINGVDSAQKLSILTAIAFRKHVNYREIVTQPLKDVDLSVIENVAKYFASSVRYLAVSELLENGSLNFIVAPFIIGGDHPLASVRENYNSIYIEGDYCRKTMLFGEGAGGRPTANAVVSDIIYISRNIVRGVAGKVPSVILPKEKENKIGEAKKLYEYYFNIPSLIGSSVQIMSTLQEHEIEIELLLKTESGIIVKTGLCCSEDIRRALRICDGSQDCKLIRFY